MQEWKLVKLEKEMENVEMRIEIEKSGRRIQKKWKRMEIGRSGNQKKQKIEWKRQTWELKFKEIGKSGREIQKKWEW